jgi:hypothetical protein
MARRIDTREPGNRGPSRGRCYLYVLPCAYEDLLKLGFSRHPLARMQSLHSRWFEFFDLERGWLIETETVRDARDLELGLGHAITEHSAPAPLVVRREAAGHTEWYRGAYAWLDRSAQMLAAGGYVRHAPLRDWARETLSKDSDRLFAWSEAMLTPDDLDCADGSTLAQRVVRDMLDARMALGLSVDACIPDQVLRWYGSVTGLGVEADADRPEV